jgi:CHAT domain-containing protein
MSEYDRAWHLADQKSAGEAISMLRDLIARDPGFHRAYGALAAIYQESGRIEDGRHYFQELIERNPWSGLAHFGLAEVYRLTGRFGSAADESSQCIHLDPKAGVCYLSLVHVLQLDRRESLSLDEVKRRIPHDACAVWARMALAYFYLGRTNLALAQRTAKSGLELAQSQGDPEALASFEAVLMAAAAGGSQYEEALKHARAALEIYGMLHDWENEIAFLTTVGSILDQLGDRSEGEDYHQRALLLARSVGHPRSEASALQGFSSHYDMAGALELAAESATEAERIWQQLGNHDAASVMATTAGREFQKMGDIPSALRFCQDARVEGEKANPPALAYALRSLGNIYLDTGEFFQSLKYQSESVRLFRDSHMEWQAGAGVGNLGSLYLDVGDYDMARRLLEESLHSAIAHGDKGEQQSNLTSLADICLRLGRPREALPYLQRSREFGQQVRYPAHQVKTLVTMATAYKQLSNVSVAASTLEEALRLSRGLRLPDLQAQSLNELGDCALRLGDLRTADERFREALVVASGAALVQLELAARRGLAEVARRRGDDEAALDHLKEAAHSLEALRSRVPTPELRSAFLNDNWHLYEDLIEVLARLHVRDPGKGYDREAFRYAEEGRARSFLDLLSESRANITSGLSESDRDRQQKLNAGLSKTLAALLKERSEKNRRVVEDAEHVLNDWALDLRRRNPRYAELTYPQPKSLLEIQSGLVNRGAVLLEYSLGKRQSYLWVISQRGVRMLKLPSRAVIERKVWAFRKLIAARPEGSGGFVDMERLGRSLYTALVSPAAGDLATGDDLVIIPDGVLHYLPFEALITNHSGTPHYQLEDQPISYAPSASVFVSLLEGLRIRSADERRELLAYGNPVFRANGRSVAGQAALPSLVRSVYEAGGFHFAPLPHTKLEITHIAALYPTGQSRIRLGAEATEASLKQETLNRYKKLHFATHALIDERVPSRSGIVLSLVNTGDEDGILRTSEIFNLTLDADVVVLSACQTGLGELVRGEGMIGLTRAFMYAGTSRVVVSLWEVNDIATADLMQAFYSQMSHEGNFAASLRAAKLTLLRSNVPAYRHPYFWAPFVLVGPR